MLDVHHVVVFTLIFLFSCLLSSLFASPDPDFVFSVGKSVFLKNKFLKYFLTFPASLNQSFRERQFQEKTELKVLGCIFNLLNYIILAEGIFFQFLPAIPCEKIEVGFGHKYRYLDFVVETYNQKIPIVSIFILLFLQLLVILLCFVFKGWVKKRTQEKIEVRWLLFLILLILINIAVLIYFIFLLF